MHVATTDPTPTDPTASISGHDHTYWRDTAEPAGLPSAQGRIDADVAIIGGGIIGLTTAVLAAEAGLRVVVLEAREIGSGTTGGTTGKVTSQNSTRLMQLTKSAGPGGAATYATATERGIALFDQLTERHDIDCDQELAPAHLVALTGDQDAQIAGEADAAREAGLQVVIDAELPEVDFPVSSSLTIPDQRQMHAVKHLLGLSAALPSLGGRVHERSRVVDVDAHHTGGRRWQLTTEEAIVDADHVVVATRLPTHRDAPITFGRTKPQSSVGIAARIQGPAPVGMYLFKGERDWSIRRSRTNGEEHLIAVGMGETTGDAPALARRSNDLIRWTRNHYPVEAVDHTWMAQDQQPSDGRPYIGPLWGEGIWTATGFGKWGLAAGIAASELLVHHMTGTDDPYDGFFSTKRLEPPKAWPTLLRANLRVGALLVGDRVRSVPRPARDLAPGDGRVVRKGRTPVAISRDLDGRVHAVSATCTHLGCLVRWNRQEATWDCACHGSRFASDGEVLEAPATAPLRPIDLDD
jgi:glycine/D-amino acid oxidase-like deaminating enzyme/nitrite reductase/ring-hydroxylating ferredoxin subunit